MAAGVGTGPLVVGLDVARDVEFQVFVFEDLSISALAGSWLELWRWTLGGLNALICGLLFHFLDRSGSRSLPTNLLLLAWSGGTLGTALTSAVLLTAGLVLWCVIGAVSMIFAGPF